MTDPGPDDHAEILSAQQRLLAKGSALSFRIEKERELHEAMDIVRLRSLLATNPKYTEGVSKLAGDFRKIHGRHINIASKHIISALILLTRITNDEGFEQNHLLRTLSDLAYAHYTFDRMIHIVNFITDDGVKYAKPDEAPGLKHLHL